MHDIRAIRDNFAAFAAAMARRGSPKGVELILELDTELRASLTALHDLQARRKAIAREVGEGRRTGADTTKIESEAVWLRGEIEASQDKASHLETEIQAVLASLPNILDDDVPDGADESGNRVIAQHGAPRDFGFTPRQHFELGEALGMMEFGSAAKLAGSRFTILRGPLARLERALGQMMVNLHTREHGYEEVQVPLLVNDAAVFGTAQLPKFADDLFCTTDGRWLIPTAEVPLTNLAAGEIIDGRTLPWRVTALSDCFRSEAGAAGRDTRGMLRQHQFRKVELVSITLPGESTAEHERMTRCAEKFLSLLDLPFRRVLLCSGDTGFSSTKTYDLEVWLPGQQAWREISSCSNCRDFQARRMNARYRNLEGKVAGFVHTLNGSGVALGRALIAVMENHQQADGSILLPAAVAAAMGEERIPVA